MRHILIYRSSLLILVQGLVVPSQKGLAAEYIKSRFEEWGLDASLQEFPTKDFEIRKSFLNAPTLGEIPCTAYGLCADTPAEGITANTAWALSGSPLEITPDIKDKILVRYGVITDELRRRIDEYKPAGIVIIGSSHSTKSLHIERVEEWDRILDNHPTLFVSYEDGLRLVRAKPDELTIITKQDINDSISCNVIGELKGSLYPDEIVVVCGHYDSIWQGVGASDNAGGTAIVMELARVFAKHGSKRTIRFIAFGSEERGLNGSRFYARELAKADKAEKDRDDFRKNWDKTELDRHVLTINIDVHGALIGSNHAAVAGTGEHFIGLNLLARELGFKLDAREYAMSSDGTSLAYFGVPAFQFARSSPSSVFLHTVDDDIAYLAPSGLQGYGNFLEELLYRWIATSAEFPLERKVSDDNMKKAKEYFEKHLKVDMEEGLKKKE